MAVKKFVFCVLFFTHAINSAEEDDSDNKKISISTVKEDSLINKNNWNTKKWGDIYLLFKPNPIIFILDILPAYTWLTLFRIFTGDILYRYIAKKGVGVMVKFGFNSSIFVTSDAIVKLSPSLTLSFCWIYKKKGKKMFSGSFCPVGMGWYNKIYFEPPQSSLENDNKDVNQNYSLINKDEIQGNNQKGNYINYNLQENTKLNIEKNKEYNRNEMPEIFSKKSFFLLFLTISYLHYENGKGFFLSWGKFNLEYSSTKLLQVIGLNLLFSILHLELGFSLLKSKHRKKNIDL